MASPESSLVFQFDYCPDHPPNLSLQLHVLRMVLHGGHHSLYSVLVKME